MDKKEHKQDLEPGAADNPDRWVISYADFITLLFAFFTTMYAISHVDRGKLEMFTGSVRAAFKTAPQTGIAVIESIKPVESELLQIGEDLKEVIEESAGMRGINVIVEEKGVRVVFPDSVIFESGSAEIKDECKPILSAVASIIKRTKNDIVIEGHTDNVPIRNAKYSSNWELSVARATSVLMYLLKDKSIDPSRFSVAGYGQYRPVAPNTTAEGRAKNRRVEIIFLKRG
jgi:chemotaxis protein MotB